MNSLISSGGGGMKYVLQATQELELESHQMFLCGLMKKVSEDFFIPEPTARSAVPGVSPGRGLLIPHGYLHPGKCEHSEV